MLKAAGLEYEVLGEGEPMLLMHGAHLAASLSLLATELAASGRYRVIRYHRRGLAGSDPVPPSSTIADMARDAAGLLKHVGAERAHVVGHSYGGVTALQLALDVPDLLQSLILLEPAIYSQLMPELGAPIAAAIARHTERYRSGDPRGAVDGFMRGAGGDPDWAASVDSVIPGSSEQAFRDAATFFEVENQALENWSFDRQLAERIARPTLFVTGSETGEIVERAKEIFSEWVPQTESVVLAGLDHSMAERAPGVVAAAIAEFTGRHST